MPRRPDMPPLDRGGLDLDPIAQFRAWFDVAEREVLLPEAMTLATVDADGDPRRAHGAAQGRRRAPAFASSPTTSPRRRTSSPRCRGRRW